MYLMEFVFWGFLFRARDFLGIGHLQTEVDANKTDYMNEIIMVV